MTVGDIAGPGPAYGAVHRDRARPRLPRWRTWCPTSSSAAGRRRWRRRPAAGRASAATPEYLVEGETITALVEGTPVGVAAVRPETGEPGVRPVTLRVDPAWQRRGIGTRLLVEAARVCERGGGAGDRAHHQRGQPGGAADGARGGAARPDPDGGGRAHRPGPGARAAAAAGLSGRQSAKKTCVREQRSLERRPARRPPGGRRACRRRSCPCRRYRSSSTGSSARPGRPRPRRHPQHEPGRGARAAEHRLQLGQVRVERAHRQAPQVFVRRRHAAGEHDLGATAVDDDRVAGLGGPAESDAGLDRVGAGQAGQVDGRPDRRGEHGHHGGCHDQGARRCATLVADGQQQRGAEHHARDDREQVRPPEAPAEQQRQPVDGDHQTGGHREGPVELPDPPQVDEDAGRG